MTFRRRNFRHAIRIERLARSQTDLFFSLSDCRLRLINLRHGLVDAEFQFGIVEPHEHLPASYRTADINADRDDLA